MDQGSQFEKNLFIHVVAVDQESGSSLARWFEVRVFHEVAVKMSTGREDRLLR